MKCFWKYMLGKFMSARFLVTVFFALTLCYAVWKCFSLLVLAMHDEKAFGLIKDIVMFMLGAFVTQVTSVINDYFKRTDRKTTDESEETTSTTQTK